MKQYRLLIKDTVKGACESGFTKIIIKLDVFKEGTKLGEIKYARSELNTQLVSPRLSGN
jgi:hypothetical protein